VLAVPIGQTVQTIPTDRGCLFIVEGAVIGLQRCLFPRSFKPTRIVFFVFGERYLLRRSQGCGQFETHRDMASILNIISFIAAYKFWRRKDGYFYLV
jgi:hypothetical protein